MSRIGLHRFASVEGLGVTSLRVHTAILIARISRKPSSHHIRITRHALHVSSKGRAVFHSCTKTGNASDSRSPFVGLPLPLLRLSGGLSRVSGYRATARSQCLVGGLCVHVATAAAGAGITNLYLVRAAIQKTRIRDGVGNTAIRRKKTKKTGGVPTKTTTSLILQIQLQLVLPGTISQQGSQRDDIRSRLLRTIGSATRTSQLPAWIHPRTTTRPGRPFVRASALTIMAAAGLSRAAMSKIRLGDTVIRTRTHIIRIQTKR